MDDLYISALIALCKREGGHRNVADKIKSNPDYLLQIVNGTKLPSGLPRGVGPSTRRKLASAYPGWPESVMQEPASGNEAPAKDALDYGSEIQYMLDKIPDRWHRIEAYAAAITAIRAVATRLDAEQNSEPHLDHEKDRRPELPRSKRA
jgi:hypothetical protein